MRDASLDHFQARALLDVIVRPSDRARLLSAWEPWLDDEELDGGEAGARLWLEVFDDLPRRHRRDPVLLGRAFELAVEIGRPSKELRRRAEVLVSRDPWHLPARLGVALSSAGPPDPSLWTDLNGVANPAALRRLEVRFESGQQPAARLGSLLVALRSDLVGDAQALASDLPPFDPDAAALLAGLAKAIAGDTADYDNWYAARRVSSPWLDQWLARWDAPGRPIRAREVGAAARRRLVERSGAPADYTLSVRTALDAEASRRVRRRAEAGLVEGASNIVVPCRDAGISADECLERSTPAYYGPPPTDQELEFSLRSGAVGLRVFEEGVDPRWVSRALDAPSGNHADIVARSIAAQLQRGEIEPARQHLAASANELASYQLAALTLELEDRSAGVHRDVAWSYLPAPSWVASGMATYAQQPHEGELGELYSGFSLVKGDPEKARDEISRLANRHQGRVRAWLLGYAAAIENTAADGEGLSSVCAGIVEAAPGSGGASECEGMVAMRAGRTAEARRRLSDALEYDPDAVAAFSALFRSVEESEQYDAEALRVLIEAAPSSWSFEHSPMIEALSSSAFDSRDAISEARRMLDGETHRPLVVARMHPALARAAVHQHLERMRKLHFGEELRQSARIGLRLIEMTDDVDSWRRERAEFLLLLERFDEALAELSNGGPWWQQPAYTTVALVEAARDGQLSPRQVADIWRWERAGGWGPEVEAAVLPVRKTLAEPEGEAVTRYACLQWTAMYPAKRAASVCERALQSDPTNVWIANELASIGGQLDRQDLVDQAFRTPPPTFAEDRSSPFPGRVSWFRQKATSLDEDGKHPEAAYVWQDAVALGSWVPPEPSIEHHPVLGAVLRASTYRWNQPAESWATLAYDALLEGDLEVASTYADAAILAAEDVERPIQGRVALTAATVDLARADRSDGSLNGLELAQAAQLMLFPDEVEDLEQRVRAFRETHARSRLAAAVAADLCIDRNEINDARAAVDLLRLRAGNHSVTAYLAARLESLAGHQESARRIYRSGRGDRRGEFLLAAVELPESVRGPDAGVPAWLRTPADFDRQQTNAVNGVLARHVNAAASHEFFAPSGWTVDASAESGSTLSSSGEYLSVEIRQRPRAKRCSGKTCIEDWLLQQRGAGATIQWAEPVELPAGSAVRAVSTTRSQVSVAISLPTGGRVFELVATSRLEHAHLLAGRLQTVARTFRPLDSVVDGFRAESMRADAKPLSDAVRLRIRKAMEAVGDAQCPIASILEDLDGDQQAAVVLDAWLATPKKEGRIALTRCAAPSGSAAADVGALAVLEDDARLHRFGSRAVFAHPQRALKMTRGLLSGPLAPPLSSPEYFDWGSGASPGLLELARALPPAEQRAVIESKIEGRSQRDRAEGWALARLSTGTLPATRAVDLATGHDLSRAVWPADYLSFARLDSALAARVRERLDELIDDGSDPARVVGTKLARALAVLGESEDRARIDRAAQRWSTDDNDYLDRLNAAHRDRVRGRTPAADDPHASVFRYLRSHAWDGAIERWRDDTALGERSLPQLVRGPNWTYARVGNPRLAITTLESLVGRLRTESAVEEVLLRRLISKLRGDEGMAIFSEEGGLDLSKPVECATSPDLGEGSVCVAHVRDADALLTHLRRRSMGRDSGLLVPLPASFGMTVLPVALTLAPALFDFVVREGLDRSNSGRAEFRQRSWDTVEIGPRSLERQVIAEARPSRIAIDNEFYALVGDRIFVFTTPELARHVLTETRESSLADDPAFARAIDGRSRTTGLLSVSVGRKPQLGMPAVSEVAFDDSGIVVRAVGFPREPVGAGTKLADGLPPGAMSTMVVGRGIDRNQIESLLGTSSGSEPDSTRPPADVFAGKGAIAFGWYPSPGKGLWDRWVAIVEPDSVARSKMQAAPWWPRKESVSGGTQGLFAGRVSKTIVLSPDRELAATAVARLHAKPDSTVETLAEGTFKGAPAAAVVGALSPGEGFPREAVAAAAALLGFFEEASFSLTRDETNHRVRLAARFELDLSDEPGLELVDAMLSATEHTNSFRLPTSVTITGKERTVDYVFRVPDPERFVAHAVIPNSRVEVEVSGPRKVTVRVASSGTEKVKLTKVERDRLLESTSMYPANDATIRKTLASIVSRTDTVRARAKKIVGWTKDRIDYEVTPRRVDGRAVLESGRGDCSEHAVLAVTLLRAAGIPAEERSGFAVSGGTMVAHAWVAFHDGQQWVEVDPTAGVMGVSAGHVPLSLFEVIALLSTGSLEIVDVQRH